MGAPLDALLRLATHFVQVFDSAPRGAFLGIFAVKQMHDEVVLGLRDRNNVRCLMRVVVIENNAVFGQRFGLL